MCYLISSGLTGGLTVRYICAPAMGRTVGEVI